VCRTCLSRAHPFPSPPPPFVSYLTSVKLEALSTAMDLGQLFRSVFQQAQLGGAPPSSTATTAPRPRTPPSGICRFCGESGHYIRECEAVSEHQMQPQRQRQLEGRTPVRSEGPAQHPSDLVTRAHAPTDKFRPDGRPVILLGRAGRSSASIRRCRTFFDQAKHSHHRANVPFATQKQQHRPREERQRPRRRRARSRRVHLRIWLSWPRSNYAMVRPTSNSTPLPYRPTSLAAEERQPIHYSSGMT
jgi:hypothetical protein